MPIEDFIIHVFCGVEQSYHEIIGEGRLRRRGFELKLSDSEVITMESKCLFYRSNTSELPARLSTV